MNDDPRTNVMLQQIALVYGSPDSDDPLQFLAVYARMMRQYTDTELVAAAERLLKTYKPKSKFKPWPTIPDCINACESERAAIRTRMAAEQNRERIAQQQAPEQLNQVELLEAQRFVDEWASGRRSLLVSANAPPEKHIEMRLLSKRLRRLAVEMHARRGRVA